MRLKYPTSDTVRPDAKLKPTFLRIKRIYVKIMKNSSPAPVLYNEIVRTRFFSSISYCIVNLVNCLMMLCSVFKREWHRQYIVMGLKCNSF